MTELARVTISSYAGIPVGAIEGEVDISNAAGIGARLTAAVDNKAIGLIVDLSATSHLDSAGLRVLFEVARRLATRQQGARAVIPEGSLIRRVVELTRLDAVLPVDPDVPAAAAELKRASDSGIG